MIDLDWANVSVARVSAGDNVWPSLCQRDDRVSEGRKPDNVIVDCLVILRRPSVREILFAEINLLPFKPKVDDPKLMTPALFLAESMGLRERISDIGIEDRISYTPESNTLFLNFAGMRVKTLDDLERIKEAVYATLKPLGRRVISIVNYDSFWVDPEIADKYMDLVRYVEANYYLKVSRYTTSGFMRIKLSRGLEERHITSRVVQNYVEATKSLKDQ